MAIDQFGKSAPALNAWAAGKLFSFIWEGNNYLHTLGGLYFFPIEGMLPRSKLTARELMGVGVCGHKLGAGDTSV